MKVEIPQAFQGLFQPHRYKAFFGGRGSAKSHSFATALLLLGGRNPLRILCGREVQNSIKDSVKQLLDDKIAALNLGGFYHSIQNEIRGANGTRFTFSGLGLMTTDQIKSMEGIDIAWIEEAQTISAASLEILIPTIRKPDSEIWFSWNPRHASDPVDARFRGPVVPEGSIVRRVNYDDNPFFPDVLDRERKYDQAHVPDRYAHIWLGDYEPMAVGAIWNRQTIHNCRWKLPVEDLPPMTRLLVAIDPAVSSLPGANEHGIIVAGLGEDGRGYVLEDASTEGPPKKWATRAVTMFDKWEADAIVAEVNQGGDMVAATLKTVRESVPVIGVRATRGKHVRAEPIAALYETGQVCHVGTFGRLEDQMCQMTAAGYEGEGSPDHVDALVWALTELFPAMTSRSKPAEGSGVRSEYDTLAGVKADYDAMEG